ncbi:putative transcription factor DP, E2F-DP heterodimerization region [Helianthus anomalus]
MYKVIKLISRHLRIYCRLISFFFLFTSQSERLALKNRIEKKNAYLRELEDQRVGLQNLIKRNEQLYSSGNTPSGGVALPFILVQV